MPAVYRPPLLAYEDWLKQQGYTVVYVPQEYDGNAHLAAVGVLSLPPVLPGYLVFPIVETMLEQEALRERYKVEVSQPWRERWQKEG